MARDKQWARLAEYCLRDAELTFQLCCRASPLHLLVLGVAGNDPDAPDLFLQCRPLGVGAPGQRLWVAPRGSAGV